MQKKHIFLAITLFITTLFSENIPEPYRSIVDLPFDGHGWFSNAVPLERLISEK